MLEAVRKFIRLQCEMLDMSHRNNGINGCMLELSDGLVLRLPADVKLLAQIQYLYHSW